MKCHIFRQPPLRIVLSLIVLLTLVGASTLLLFHQRTSHAAGTATLSTSVRTVHVGQTIIVTGDGFAPNETVNLQIDGYPDDYMTALSCDSNGSCQASVTIPTGDLIVQGEHDLIGTGSTSNLIARTPLNFIPVITLRAPQVEAKSNAHTIANNTAIPQVGPGTQLALSGYSFAANETVQVYLGDTTGLLLGTTTADTNGLLYFPVNTPTLAPPGTYTVTVARSQQKPATLSKQFEIIPPQLNVQSSFHSGQHIPFRTKGFQAYETIILSWNANGGQQLGSFFADFTGTGLNCIRGNEVNCVILPSAPSGTYTLTATGKSSHLTATSSITVEPGIVLSSAFGGPGSILTVTGGGFTPQETVHVYFQNTHNGVVSATSDTTGGFSVPITLPTKYDPNMSYYVYATNQTGSEHFRAPFQFVSPALYVETIIYGVPTGITGSGFYAHETLDFYWHYQQAEQRLVAKITADQYGNFSAAVKTPSTLNPNNLQLGIVGEQSGFQATDIDSEQGALALSPAQGPAGTAVKIRGGCFGSQETVTVIFGTSQVATATTDKYGAFATTFVVPASTSPFPIEISATGNTTHIGYSTTFTVTK